MEDIIQVPTDKTVVNKTSEVIEVISDEKKDNDENQKNDLIPRSRLNEVISQKNDFKSKLEELQSNYEKLVNEKETEINNYKNEIKSVSEKLSQDIDLFKNKYEETIYKNSNVEDIQYLKFLVSQKENLDLEEAINTIKTEKPNIFLENRKQIGTKPNGNDSKLTQEQFSQIKDRNERMKIIRNGLI